VLRHLEEQGRGLPTKYGVIPICPSATLFDLGFGDARVRPDLAMGRAACLAATGESFTLGSVGAGCVTKGHKRASQRIATTSRPRTSRRSSSVAKV